MNSFFSRVIANKGIMIVYIVSVVASVADVQLQVFSDKRAAYKAGYAAITSALADVFTGIFHSNEARGIEKGVSDVVDDFIVNGFELYRDFYKRVGGKCAIDVIAEEVM